MSELDTSWSFDDAVQAHDMLDLLEDAQVQAQTVKP